MVQKDVKKERSPLATGFLSKGNIYFNIRFPFVSEFSSYNKLGKDLIDFAWFDTALIDDIFDIIWRRYMAYKIHKNDNDFIAAGLLRTCEKFLKLNSYVSIYLLTAIDFLLESNVDRRVLTYENEIQEFAKLGYFAEADTGEMFDIDKRQFLHIFLTCITERQMAIERTLDKILGDDSADSGQSAMARICQLEQEDEYFRKHWHSKFESYIGKVNEHTEKYASLTALGTVDDMMRYELIQMILRSVKYKRCQCCGKLFLPSGRSDSLYCARIMPGQTRPCADIGANLVAVEKRRNHPELRIYRQAYERLYKRVEMGYMEQLAFAEWDKQAREKRDACHAGKLTLDEFVQWVDKTSRQRRGK